MNFDLPAGPLKTTLAVFDQRTNLSVFFPSELVDGKMSAPVQGMYTPQAALALLLKGTGLVLKTSAPGTFFLATGEDPVPGEVAAMPPAEDARYAGLLQAHVLRALCRRKEIEPGGYRLAMSISLDDQGKVAAARLLASTGDKRRDRLVLEEIGHIDTSRRPPAQARPFVILIRPRAESGAPVCPAT